MPALAEKRMPGADLRDLLLYAISHNVSILEGLADPERENFWTNKSRPAGVQLPSMKYPTTGERGRARRNAIL
jgi:hypothetical protein